MPDRFRSFRWTQRAIIGSLHRVKKIIRWAVAVRGLAFMKLSRATLVLTAASALVWTMAPRVPLRSQTVPGYWPSPTLQPFYGYVLFYGTWVEYQVDSAGQFPAWVTPLREYCRLSAVRNQAPVMGLALHESLETDARLAITAQTPVRCYLKSALDSPTWQEVPESCSQDGMPNPNGGLTFGTRPLNYGESFKVSVPLVVNKTKSGIGDGDAAGSSRSSVTSTRRLTRCEPINTSSSSGGSGRHPRNESQERIPVATHHRTVACRWAEDETAQTTEFRQSGLQVQDEEDLHGVQKRVVKAKAAGTCKIKAKAKRGKGKIIRITIR